ncbi:MAG TPA: dephospho-CoA kinase, partial [Acidimicrobiales bacterium]|nr:dephospho-CoA kinase [Acidimicrobiales bacterium]
MLVVGLTGGIGSGKSTVAALLARRGAVTIDVDVLARAAVEPDGPAYREVVERFGAGVVAADGRLDRARLASLVFADPAARRDLEAIVHPAVRAGVARRVAELAAGGDGDAVVVVVEIPLLAESPASRAGLGAVIVVDCPEEVAVARLVAARGMSEADARARIAAQASREERLALAGFVVDNSGSPDDLAAEVDRCWAWLEGLP